MEVNPGPFPPWKKDEEVENLQKIIDDQEDEIVDLKSNIKQQGDVSFKLLCMMSHFLIWNC